MFPSAGDEMWVLSQGPRDSLKIGRVLCHPSGAQWGEARQSIACRRSERSGLDGRGITEGVVVRERTGKMLNGTPATSKPSRPSSNVEMYLECLG